LMGYLSFVQAKPILIMCVALLDLLFSIALYAEYES
jgi:hypothetical protein